MLDFENKPVYGIDDLISLIGLLRGPGGCPWDAEQTHESIRRNLLEEAYETAEAIDNGDTDNLIEELGDVLMQVIFHADIAAKDGSFSLGDVINATCGKLIRRHPHVFGEVKAKNGAESLGFWDDIKRGEKLQDTASEAMNSVARSLPALWRAEKVQKKAAKSGFDWPVCAGAMEALKSEIDELDAAISGTGDVEEELGDILFSTVNVARYIGVDPEKALGRSCDKFIERFSKLEKKAGDLGLRLEDMTFEEMDALYMQGKLEK